MTRTRNSVKLYTYINILMNDKPYSFFLMLLFDYDRRNVGLILNIKGRLSSMEGLVSNFCIVKKFELLFLDFCFEFNTILIFFQRQLIQIASNIEFEKKVDVNMRKGTCLIHGARRREFYKASFY